MIFDTHIHTTFSTDSSMPIDKVLEKSRQLGLGVTITDHMDLAYPKPDAFMFDVNAYFEVYNRFRSDSVLLGIEVGMRADCLTENREIVAAGPFDYIIGSIHVIDNIDIYEEAFYRNNTKQQVYNQYFDAMIDCLKCYDFIDSLGHIDYITRYARFKNPELYYHEFSEKIDQVLIILAEQEKCLEINTRRLGSRDAVEALIPIYRRFTALGGKYVTIGSDAHKQEDIGRGLDAAIALAGNCRLKVVFFKNRKPELMKL